MARFADQPFVTTEMWSLMLRFLVWIVLSSILHDMAKDAVSLLLVGLLGLGVGLALVIVAWGSEHEESDTGSSRIARLKKYLGITAAVTMVGLWLWQEYQQIADGIENDDVFFAGYLVGLACVGVASARGYLRSGSSQ